MSNHVHRQKILDSSTVVFINEISKVKPKNSEIGVLVLIVLPTYKWEVSFTWSAYLVIIMFVSSYILLPNYSPQLLILWCPYIPLLVVGISISLLELLGNVPKKLLKEKKVGYYCNVLMKHAHGEKRKNKTKI